MKRNLLRIPRGVLDRLNQFGQDDVVAACVKLLQAADVGRYEHLGLRLAEGRLVVPSTRIPDPSAGRYSHANVYGYEKVRKDLPKVQKEFGYWAPNWGDWSNGSHWVSNVRDVYVRDLYQPKEVELSVTLLKEQNGAYLVKFQVEQVINRRTPNFARELLYNLNILQENVGAADVFESAATLADYAATVKVDWQIFPPGSVEEVVRQLVQTRNPVTPEQEATVKKRVALMAKLHPKAYIAGSDGFLRYFGAMFGDDFVVFENARYGNAIYVMREQWKELSKRSRVDLLRGPRDSFERIEHREGWEERLEGLVKAYREGLLN